MGTDKSKLKVKMQSVSDDDVWKRLLEKPRFELAAKGVFRLGRCYIFWQGVPGLCFGGKEQIEGQLSISPLPDATCLIRSDGGSRCENPPHLCSKGAANRGGKLARTPPTGSVYGCWLLAAAARVIATNSRG